MENRIRDKYHRILDGYMPVHNIAVRLHYLDCHFPSDKLSAALSWLISNGIKGQRFVDWFEIDCIGSHLMMQKILLKNIEKTADIRPIFANKLGDIRL